MQTIVPLLLILLGTGLLGLGIFQFFRQTRKIRQAVKAEGVVTQLIRVRARNSYVRIKTATGTKLEPKYRYRAQVRFTTETGQKINLSSPVSYRPARHQVGEKVEVLFNPHNPAEAWMNGFWELWFLTFMLIFWGVFALGMGGIAWLLQNQKI